MDGVPEGLDKASMDIYFEFMRANNFNAVRLLFNHQARVSLRQPPSIRAAGAGARLAQPRLPCRAQAVLANLPINVGGFSHFKNPQLANPRTGIGVSYIEMLRQARAAPPFPREHRRKGKVRVGWPLVAASRLRARIARAPHACRTHAAVAQKRGSRADGAWRAPAERRGKRRARSVPQLRCRHGCADDNLCGEIQHSGADRLPPNEQSGVAWRWAVVRSQRPRQRGEAAFSREKAACEGVAILMHPEKGTPARRAARACGRDGG